MRHDDPARFAGRETRVEDRLNQDVVEHSPRLTCGLEILTLHSPARAHHHVAHGAGINRGSAVDGVAADEAAGEAFGQWQVGYQLDRFAGDHQCCEAKRGVQRMVRDDVLDQHLVGKQQSLDGGQGGRFGTTGETRVTGVHRLHRGQGCLAGRGAVVVDRAHGTDQAHLAAQRVRVGVGWEGQHPVSLALLRRVAAVAVEAA